MMILAVVALAFGTSALATPPLFSVTHPQRSGELLLAGTVHFLPDRDTATPAAFERAYDRADRLVFELDLSRDMTQLGRQMLPLAQDEPDGLLVAIASPGELDRLAQDAEKAGLPFGQLVNFEAWFVMLQLNAMLVHRHGLDSASGVESIYAARAASDGKPVEGLETIREQLRYFDDISNERQLVLLRGFLDEADEFGSDLDAMIAAWKNGDDQQLDDLLQASWEESPDLAEALLYSRNRDWRDKLEAYFGEPETTLVMVGAGHLVGERSVPDLLRQRGYAVERVGE